MPAIKEKNRLQRRTTHASREALRPPEEQIESIDFDKISRPLLSQARLHAFQAMKEWVKEFFEDVEDCFDSDKYFKGKESAILTIAVCRKFFHFLASSRRGRLPDASRPNFETTPSRVTLKTMEDYFGVLCGVVKFYAVQFETEVMQQILWWIRSDLVDGGYVSLEVRAKPIAYANDVSSILRCLFTPKVMCSYRSPKILFGVCLFINLAIDSCGRIGEIVATYRYPHQFLAWDDVEFLVHRGHSGENIFTAIVNFKWLKGKRLDPSKYKKITLRLLPAELAFEDTLRQLLILALSEGILDGVSTWEDLERLEPGPGWSGIAINESRKGKPILCSIRSVGKDDAAKKPMYSDAICTKLGELGQLTGFQERLTSYCFRRGIAYTLKAHTDKGNRTFLMGHNQRSKIFDEYQSRISVIDFQAIARGLIPTENVHEMGGMSIRRREDVPKQLSKAGFDIVMTDIRLKELDEEAVEASDACRLLHGTIKAGKAAGSTVYKRYCKAFSAKNLRFQTLAIARYREEYKQHMEKSMLATTPSSTSTTSPETQSNFQYLESPNMRPESYEGDEGDDGDDRDSEHDFYERDAESQSDVSNATMEFQQAVLAYHHEAEACSIDSSKDDNAHSDVRLHNIHVDTVRRAARGGIRLIAPRNMAFADIYTQVTESNLTNAQVAGWLVPFTSITHGLDTYPPSLMPTIGTDSCTRCGTTHQHAIGSEFLSTFQCHAKGARERAKTLWQSMMDKLPRECPWERKRKGERCGKTFNGDDSKRQRHLLEHLQSKYRPGPPYFCRFAPCSGDGSNFTNVHDRNQHMETSHSYLPAPTPSAMYSWCGFCEDFVWEVPYTHGYEQHFAHHMPEAFSNVQAYGYQGVELSKRQVVPLSCIFCLHDSTKLASDRLYAMQPNGELLSRAHDHVLAHITALDADSNHFCPASEAAKTDVVLCRDGHPMKVDELKLHLLTVHGIDIADSKKNGRKRKQASDDDEPKQTKVDASKARNPLSAIATNKLLESNQDKNIQAEPTDSPNVDLI